MNKLEDILNRCKESKKVYIYGDGEVGRLTRVFLHEQGIEIDGFITTYAPKRSEVMSVPACELDAFTVNPNDVYVLACMHKKWWEAVLNSLSEREYKNVDIIDDDLRIEIDNKVRFADLYEDVEKNINVLLYHRVENLPTAYSIIVNERNFESQLKYIKSNYNLLSCADDWSNVNEKSVALTFDDGYVDFYSKTYPLLKKYNVPATVFVSTGGIDNNKEFWWDELEMLLSEEHLPATICTKRKEYVVSQYPNRALLIMDVRNEVIENTYKVRDEEIALLRKQIKPMAKDRSAYRTMNSEEIVALSKEPLITIGAHTINHILCDKESYDIQKHEIKESKEVLEALINKEINLFAYPNGNIGKDTRGILDELGFEKSFTCEHACIDKVEKKFDIPRSAVLNWDESQLERRFRGMWQTSKDI